MVNRFKNIKTGILAGVAGIVLGCSTISVEPTGSIDLAYVPIRVDDHVVRNQIMGEIGANLEGTIQKGPLEDLQLTFGVRQRVFVTPINIYGINWVSPSRQEYGLKTTVGYENFKFYIDHFSTHPVSGEQFWIPNTTSHGFEEEYYIGIDSLTRIGLKWEF